MIWRDAVLAGLKRLSSTKATPIFTRQELIRYELKRIEQDAGSVGETPAQTLSRVLQELRDDKMIEFLGDGSYLLLADPIRIEDTELTDEAMDYSIQTQKLIFGEIETGESKALVRQRRGQRRLRKFTLENYGYQCALCDIKEPTYLVTSHLARWADYPKGRGDLSNIICLCQWHDPLLEYGLISLTEDYQILKKPIKDGFLHHILDITQEFRLPKTFLPSEEYLALHRQRAGFE